MKFSWSANGKICIPGEQQQPTIYLDVHEAQLSIIIRLYKKINLCDAYRTVEDGTYRIDTRTGSQRLLQTHLEMSINCNRAQPVIYWASLNVLNMVDNPFFRAFH